MVVLTFSSLLPQIPPRTTFSLPAPPHVSRFIHIQSRSSRPSPVLAFASVRHPARSSAQENGGGGASLEEEDAAAGGETFGEKKEGAEETFGRKKKGAEQAAPFATAEEIKEMMEAKKKSSAPDLWGGVVEEVREIEWPAFGKILSTTGVVLAVIAGSSIALLTVNAILAEISDRVFAGRGVQDFFLG
ncbi:preprotein translocase subunit SECE1 [Cocos nucifera]|uniref:Preprotein translocase subunit SECE1 n=1 Tax=Cocos nucifera TaxID=13894 RepID=A0A8K0HZM5_COCNU|nr:preprotein translocase subunit SECE1 [Cocos nucifera]